MNILFIYDAPLCPEAGGTERATKLVMDELDRRGHNCIGILHFDQQNPDVHYLNGVKVGSLFDFLTEKQIDVVVNQIAFHPRFLNQFLAHGGQQWKDKSGKIVSFMHLDPTPAPRKKLKTYFRDWNQKSLIGKIKRLTFLLCLPYLNYKTDIEYNKGLRYLYDNSDFYVLMSKSFIGVFAGLAKLDDTSKIRIIPNMLTFSEIATTDILDQKENNILVVARLDDEQKNISFIIDAWRKIKGYHNYTLHILGDGQDRELLHNKAKDIEDLVFEGAQTPIEWYKKAKICLMASPREGWGLTITESLQNGVVPVVLNTSTVFKDIINNGENGFLPDTMQDYTVCIEYLIKNKEQLNLMAKNGLNSAKRFSPEVVGNLWESMLNEQYD